MRNPLTPVAIWLGSLETTRKYNSVIVRIDNTLTSLTGGRVPLLRLVSLSELVLEVPGRHTGVPRRIPLLCRAWENGFVIVGSNWGQPRVPAWVHNLRAAGPGEVTVEIRGCRVVMDATELTGDRRVAAFDAARQQWPNYDIYARRTTRVLPVFHLIPRL